ncbi:MAG TPA: HD domain-containing protein, partial [Candidatus Aerophobetes bacterium]|nr:HD domain-containing protein [Candidatus Aerophobetes bacterium]
GYQILQPITFLKEGLVIVLYHHERYDGKGYPKGLKGKQIPFPARLFTIIDAYDAMTTKRCYRDKLSPEEAIKEITRQKDKQFDPSLVDLLIPHFMTLKQDGYLDNL